MASLSSSYDFRLPSSKVEDVNKVCEMNTAILPLTVFASSCRNKKQSVKAFPFLRHRLDFGPMSGM